MNEKCPICGAEVKMTRDYLDGHTLLEEYGGCGKHWGFEFAYGNYRESIGEKEFYWSYRETPENRKSRRSERNAAIEAEKKKL
jgi:hypothetical protein